MNKRKLLLVDDEKNILKSLKRLFIDTDYKVLTAESGEDGLKYFDDKNHGIQVVMADYKMPKMTGVEFLKEVRNLSPTTIRLILSGYADVSAIVEAINDGQIYKFLAKPWNDQELLTTILRTFEQYDLERNHNQLNEELQNKNLELEELTKNLEKKVLGRTKDLEIRNKALNITRNILNEIPVGVFGVDNNNTLVYMNDALSNFISSDALFLGNNIFEIVPDDLSPLIQTALESNNMVVEQINNGKTNFVSKPLTSSGGIIGIFCQVNPEKYLSDYNQPKETANVK